jgi:ribosomal protein L40E
MDAVEQDVLACVGFDALHVELSELDVCRECGARIWVSPSGRKMQKEQNLKLLCMDCLPADAEIATMNPEQAKELLDYVRSKREGAQ